MTLSPYSFGSQQQNQSFKMENISVENIPNNKGFAFIWDLKTINNTEAWMRINNVCTMCARANFLVWNLLPRVFFTSKAMIGGITVAKIWILIGNNQAVYGGLGYSPAVCHQRVHVPGLMRVDDDDLSLQSGLKCGRASSLCTVGSLGIAAPSVRCFLTEGAAKPKWPTTDIT